MFPAHKVVVPLDLSSFSLKALDVARGVAASAEAVHVVTVLQHLPPMQPGVVWDTINDTTRIAEVQDLVRGVLAKHELEGAHVHVHIASGNPAVRIADITAELEAELVVISSHGRTGLTRLTMGSVAERVIRLAHCPVLVLRD